MSVTIECSIREKLGSRFTSDVRRSGFVPAVVYGAGKDNLHISICARELKKNIDMIAYEGAVRLSCSGTTHDAVLRGYDVHPITGHILHLDFAFALDRVSKFSVPLLFKNKGLCEAIKFGAVLNIVKRTVKVKCRPGDLPKNIAFDVSKSCVGDSIKFSDLVFPEGVVPVLSGDTDSVVATMIGKRSAAQASSSSEDSKK